MDFLIFIDNCERSSSEFPIFNYFHFVPRPLPSGMIIFSSLSYRSTRRMVPLLTDGHARSISEMEKGTIILSIVMRM